MSSGATRGAPASASPGLNSTDDSARIARTLAARKWQRFLRALLNGPQTSRQLELAPVFDHCAHSTAADLRRRGVAIDTEMVEIAGYAGLPAHIARYSLTEAGRAVATQLLSRQ